ncbi:LOW QUALITY PROTEIN: glyoxylase-like metal-dependent hydrolase (beta-lactamase superfamily II) [Chryseobacterium daecheongense]|uniref:Glyoxylase-like metal-dependent hydrolase (Beta-lactamase superfamily II) n=1 Tax=Chryseobacterium daecheongense TaxID=192389 RepID=A0ABY2FVG6_9FLAO|nr:LOW QUALITY PROTEIN: glyoxylase-like metal-dependent hydrolase (beta-lactamase superfamily II) [Chryseobacterium daecheongense]
MKVEQIYTGCLAHGAYYIASKGEAAIIDPLRETTPYLEKLKNDGVELKYIFETHFHADFVSGHLDLANETLATIIYGPTAKPGFVAHVAEDNEIFKLGNVTIKVIHTPGHTMESSCFLLIDEEGKETALFSGDTLFLGDVGRPDLAQKAAHMTKEELAGVLYKSIYHKILPLKDEIIVYPGHGEGSLCGKKMMKETSDTLGNQKKVNYALNQLNKESFVSAVLEGLSSPPGYFEMNATMNREGGGYESFKNVLRRGISPLSVEEFETKANTENVIILDTRDAGEFHQGFIENSVNIGLKGTFAPWVGAIIQNVRQPILLVTENGKHEEAITRLSRVGFDNVVGYLEGGFETWKKTGKKICSIHRISAREFVAKMNDDVLAIDVRKESEYSESSFKGTYNKPLADINQWIGKINNLNHFYLYCQGGYRSMIAASLLYRRGYTNFTEVEGGYTAISQVMAELIK